MTPSSWKFDDIIVLKMANGIMENKNLTPWICFSVSLEDCSIRNMPLPHVTLKELWAPSEFLLVNDAISVWIGVNYCIKRVYMANTKDISSCTKDSRR